MYNRRDILKAAAALPFAARVRAAWDDVPAILARIKPPVFPPRDFEITRYGAAGDGVKDCTDAFRKAIHACGKAGGGRVVVPSGTFLTGPIHLESNVNLHLASGAVVRFVHDPARYLPAVYTRFEGAECMNYSPFIYAFGQENLAITGSGTIDGQAKSGPWYAMNDNSKPDRELLLKMAADGVPVEKRVFGGGHNLRPNFVQFYRSKNILVEGVTITDGPMWTVHPVLCRNVTVRGIKIVSYGPNTDGVDPESSSDVLIENVSFNTDDDSIAIKSGRNDDGRRVNVPCENIVVRHCRMGKVRRNALAIGSEVTGGVRNVYIEDCVLADALRGVYIKSNTQRGGVVENIWFRNVRIEDIKEPAIRIGTDYGNEKGPHVPVMRNIVFEGVRARRCGMALQISGEPNSPVTNVRLKNCTFEEMAGPDRIRNCKGLVRE